MNDPKLLEKLPREEWFTSELHSTRVAARLGMALGVTFTICFLTGLISHFIQHPQPFLPWPSHPVWLYRLTQGLHVGTGILTIPLLAAKLWTVAPKLWARPLLGGPVRALERLSILVLIASGVFELITGLLNVAEYYPWTFFFTSVHYAVAWVAIGSIVVHIAVKLPVIRSALGAPVHHPDPKTEAAAVTATATAGSTPSAVTGAAGHEASLSRRGLLGLVLGASGVVTLATIGDRIPVFSKVSVLSQRTGEGPQGLPVNRSAAAAGVKQKATSDDWRLVLRGPSGETSFSLQQLKAMPQVTADLPISCVEGWARTATWTGVRLRDLLAAAGLPAETGLRLISLDNGLYSKSEVLPGVAADDLTLIALRLGGNVLALDHGYPARLIASNRPGVLQTKWLSRMEVMG